MQGWRLVMKRYAGLIVAAIIFNTVCLFASENRGKIYIKPFVKIQGLYDMTIEDEVRDYMSEALAGDYSLISDDEVQVYLSNMAMGQAMGSNVSAEKLLASIKTDYLIHGKIMKNGAEYIIEATLLRMNESIVTIKNIGDIHYSNRNYTDRAARALAKYLMMDKKSIGGFFGHRDPREKFKEEIKDVEEEMCKIETRYQEGSRSIKKSAIRREESLIKSPRLRMGYSGFSMFRMMDSYLQDLYEPEHLFMVDLVFYRYKDPVGDGIDLYARGTYRTFNAVESYSSLVKTSAYADSLLGNFSSVPLDAPELVVYSGDLGMRFVGSVYMLRSAVSFYFCMAARLNYAVEKATLADGSDRRSFHRWGAMAGAGMEFSIMPSMGFFVELDAGYVPMGKDESNIEGPQLLAGVTMRTRHW